jgi:hypothetical protein
MADDTKPRRMMSLCVTFILGRSTTSIRTSSGVAVIVGPEIDPVNGDLILVMIASSPIDRHGLAATIALQWCVSNLVHQSRHSLTTV